MDRAGVEVLTYRGEELSKGDGGPTCLTRPLLRVLRPTHQLAARSSGTSRSQRRSRHAPQKVHSCEQMYASPSGQRGAAAFARLAHLQAHAAIVRP